MGWRAANRIPTLFARGELFFGGRRSPACRLRVSFEATAPWLHVLRSSSSAGIFPAFHSIFPSGTKLDQVGSSYTAEWDKVVEQVEQSWTRGIRQFLIVRSNPSQERIVQLVIVLVRSLNETRGYSNYVYYDKIILYTRIRIPNWDYGNARRQINLRNGQLRTRIFPPKVKRFRT